MLAAQDDFEPLASFRDELDNDLASSEVGCIRMALRRAFRAGGQLILTSHNPEAIRRFSGENTFALLRNSHLEPTLVRSIAAGRADEMLHGNLVEALLRGDVMA